MKKVLTICMLAASLLPAEAQQLLTLDSCRSMALRNNKQMGISKLKQDIAANTRKAWPVICARPPARNTFPR